MIKQWQNNMKPTPLFKIRCSQIGKIMGGALGKPTQKQLDRLNELQERANGNGKPLTDNMKIELAELIEKRDAKPQLQDGAKTYLQTWMKEQLYNRTKEFSNQYTAKGILCEPAAIQFVSEMMGYGLIEKNTERKENEWLTGECDLNLFGIVEDIKNSWDVFTFPLFATELPEKDYYYQLQGYMWLYGKHNAAVNYCLIDAPEEIIDQVARSVSYQAGNTEVDFDLYEEVRVKMTFSDIPNELKLKRFEFDRNETVIQAIKERVELCRIYVSEQWEQIHSTSRVLSASKLLENI